MLVGPTGGGKTLVNKVLAEAQCACNQFNLPGLVTTKRVIMNPKAIYLHPKP